MSADLKNMEAVILCGGLGTRLREETEFKPKPMVEIGGYPILWHIMKRYSSFGIKRFIICLGYKGDIIRNYFLNYRYFNRDFTIQLSSGDIMVAPSKEIEDWEVVLAETGDDTMTGSRIAQALQHVRGDEFFATYGDGVADVDIDALYAQHSSKGKLATLTSINPPSRYGEIQENDNGVIEYFIEKPQVSQGRINGGFFVFNREVFKKYGPSDPAVETQCYLESDILTSLANDSQLVAYQHDGFWQCMDTFREMQMLNKMWAEGNAPWSV